MQQHFGAALYEDHNYFGRSSAESFTLEGGIDHPDSGSGLLDLADTLEKQLEASNLALGELPSAGGPPTLSSELQEAQVEFELDDNGQLLQDMLQQQQPATASQQPQHQNHHHHHQQQQQQPSASSWEENVHVLQEMLMVQQQQQIQAQQQNFFSTAAAAAAAPKLRRESELLSLLQLPRCASSSLPAGPFNSVSSKKLSHPVAGLTGFNSTPELGSDPHLHGQQLLAQPSLRHLLHTLPHSATDHLGSSKPAIIRPPGLLDLEERDAAGHEDNRLFPNLFEKRPDFTFGKGAENRVINHFATERQRREYLNEKYQTLRSLVPNPSKADRASIVADAIDYVKELKRTVQELQLLVQEKKRSSSKRRCKSSPDNPSGDGAGDVESSSGQAGQGTRVSKEATFIGDGSQLRSSWLQRTSQMGTHIDVRIVDDEVNIKVTQRRRRNCVLLAVLQSLHELRLDLLHANGASIGEHHIFMFNTKIMEGASTFAGQVATKLIDAVDRHITLASSGL